MDSIKSFISTVGKGLGNGLANGFKSATSPINWLFPGAGTAYYQLKNCTDILNNLPSGVNSTLKAVTNPIFDEMWSALCGQLYGLFAVALYNIINMAMISNFSPNFNLFRDYFNADFASVAFRFIRYGGLTIAGCIFIWGFISISLGYIIETKDTMFQLIARFIITALLICIAPYICEIGCSLASTAFDTASNIVMSATSNQSGNVALEAAQGALSCVEATVPTDESLIQTIQSAKVDSSIEFVSSMASSSTLLLQAILIVCICIEVFKCAVEIIKRYVLSNLLWLFSPGAVATFSSSSTQPIFFSYMRMFNSQMILLVLNVFFIGGFVLMVTNRDAYTVLHLFTIIAWLQIANSVEKFLNSIGLNAVTTGGALVNCVGSTVRGMMMAGIATDRARKGIANGLISIGTKTSDMGAVSSGLKLAGKGSGAGSTLTTAIQHAGAEGLKYNNSLASSIASAHKAGQYSIVSASIGQIQDPIQRKQAIKNLLSSTTIGPNGKNLLPSGITGNNMHKLEYNPNGSISWSSNLDMGDGTMKAANFRIDSNSNGKSVMSFEDLDGNTKFLHSDGIDGGLDVGDRISFNSQEEGLSTVEAIGGIPINNLGDSERNILNSNLDAAEYLGGNEWALLDTEANRIASYNGNTGEFHIKGNSEMVTPEAFQNTVRKDSEGNTTREQSLGQHLGYRNVEIFERNKDGFKFSAEEYSHKTGEYGSRKEYVATDMVTHNLSSEPRLKKLDLGSAGYYGIVPQDIGGGDQKNVEIDRSKLKTNVNTHYNSKNRKQ